MTYKVILPLIASILFLSCSDNTADKDEIKVKLKQTVNNNIAFNESYNTLLLSTISDDYPEYYKSQLNAYGISRTDSIIISTANTDYKRFKYELYKNGFIEKDAFVKLKIDSLIEENKPKQNQLIVAVSFKGDDQVLTIDTNKNKDFSDDKSVVFDKDFRLQANDTHKIKNLPKYDFAFWNYHNNTITEFERKISIYPYSNYPNFSYSDDEFENKSRLIAKFKDHWQGKFNYKSQNYDVAVQGVNSLYSVVLIKPQNLKFSDRDFFINDNFKYKIKDTISIAGDLFVLGSINNNLSELVLKKINFDIDNFFSGKIGYKIFNFDLNNLDNQTAKLSEITNNKKYILLDFWGTWCEPCIKLTPRLKQFNKDFSEDIDLISIALDNDVQIVKNYTQKNNIGWYQAYVNRKDRNGSIVAELSIVSYPTFILLDANKKIIYRGVGESAFNEIEKIIKSTL